VAPRQKAAGRHFQSGTSRVNVFGVGPITKKRDQIMHMLTRIVLLAATLALAACQNPDRFGAGSGAGGPGDGIGTTGLGDASDPTSPAYFRAAIGDTVRFAVDQHVLTPDAQATLGAQAQWLVANPSYAALIEGHADEQGTRIYNINLGERRANSVREFLISRGVAGNRITTISYGKERPLAVCSDESCFAQNRRAVTVVTVGAIS
jgi:peptidoglycan-associated lipoprotein